MKKEPIFIIKEYLESLDSFERTPFPLKEPMFYQDERKKGQIKVAFGLQAQGRFDFVERAIADGMGWHQIGNSIGWIGFGVLKSYYDTLNRELYDSMGLLMVDCNRKPFEGRAVYDPVTHELEIAKETIKVEDNDPFSSLKNVIDTVQFIVKDKELFEKSPRKIPPVYMVESSEPTNIIFHTTLTKGKSVIVANSISFYNLLIEIVEMKTKGWEQKGKIYYDLLELDEDKKYYVRENFVDNLLSLNFG